MSTRIVIFSLLLSSPAFADLADFVVQNQLQREQQRKVAEASQSNAERRQTKAPTAQTNPNSEQLQTIKESASGLLSTIQTLADQSGRSSQILGGLIPSDSNNKSESSSKKKDSQIVGEDTLLQAIRRAGRPSDDGAANDLANGTIKDLIQSGTKTTQSIVMNATRQAQLAMQQKAEATREQGSTTDRGLGSEVQQLGQSRSASPRGSGAFGFALGQRRPSSNSERGLRKRLGK